MLKHKMESKQRIILILMLLVFSSGICAQKRVKGIILDNKEEPLIGVSIEEKGARNGTVTDSDGRFQLVLNSVDPTISISYVGYVKQELRVNGRSEFVIRLEENQELLDEVVVVGYGAQKKINVTAAISQVDAKELKTAPTSNLSAMLQGRLPGLVSKQSSGQPGADGANLYIRGLGMGDGSALIVVDGVVRESFPPFSPDEIESVTILKDAASAAVYGVRASGGVILITTKRGSIQKPTVTVNSSIAISSNTNFPKFLNGPEYAYWYNKAQEMDQVKEENRRFTADEIYRITNGDPQGTYGNTDWFDLLFKSSAPTYNNNVSLSGGTDKLKYFVSLGAYNQEGVIDRTSYDRYNVRSNIDAQVTKDFSISVSMSGRKATTEEPGLSAGFGNTYASILGQALMSYPYLPAYTSDGSYVGSLNSTNGNQSPLAARDLSGNTVTKQNQLEGNLNMKYNIPLVKGLSVKANLAYNKIDSNKKVALLPYKLNVFNQSTRVWSEEYARHSSSGTAQVNQWYTNNEVYTIQPSIEYANNFGDHSLNVLFLYEYTRKESESLSGGRKGYPIQDIMDLSFGDEVIESLTKGGHGLDRRAGYVGRVNYSYKDKYMVEATARYDGTPYLPSEYRWGLFPGVSAGWRISEEPFFKEKFSNVDNLKLRASIGRLGSDRSLNYSYSYFSTMSLGKDPVVMIGDKLSRPLSPSSPPNIHLKWQLTDSYNIGFESTLWKGLLGLEFDLFYSKTSRTLQGQTTNYPPSLGVYYPTLINYGEHYNKGFELVISHQNSINQFRYNVKGNVSWARNKIQKTTEDVNVPSYVRATGKPKGQYWGFEAIGLFQSEEEIANSAVYGPTLPGDIKLRDVNGDGRITWDQDMVPIGKSNIPEMMFGLNLSAEYKGFDVNMFLQGAAMVDVALCGIYTDKDGIRDNTFYTKPFYVDGNSPKYLLEGSWTPENTNAKYPRLGVESRDNGGKFSSWWVVDGSYLRVKSAQLGYTLPRKITKTIGIDKLRVYASGSNLFTFSHLDYLDPEMPNVNQGYYPQQRVFEFGANLTF